MMTSLFESVNDDLLFHTTNVHTIGSTSNTNDDSNHNESKNDNKENDEMIANQNQHQQEEKEYKNLMTTISNLKSELEETKHKSIQTLNENNTLQQEQKELHNKLSNINTRFNETKKSLLQLMDDTNVLSCCSREREQHGIELKWRYLVEKERNEIIDQKKEYLNQVQQLQNMRGQIRQEIEKEYNEQIESLVREKDEWEDKYYTMRHNHELNEVKNKVTVDTMMKQVEASKKAREDDVADLQQAMTNQMEGTADSANQLDQLRMDVDEANVTVETLTKSEKELRKSLQVALEDRNSQELAKDQAISSYEIKLTEIRGNISTKGLQSEALQNEVGHLKKTLDTLNGSLKQMREELTTGRAKISTLTSQLETRDDNIHQLEEDLKLEQHRSSTQVKSELCFLKQENASLVRQKQILESNLHEARNGLNRMKTEMVVKEESVKREMETTLNNTIIENSKLHFKVTNLDVELKQKVLEHKHNIQKLTHDCETTKHHASLAAKENCTHVQRHKMLEGALDELKLKYQDTLEQLEDVSGKMILQKQTLESCEEKLCEKESNECILTKKLDKAVQDQKDTNAISMKEKEQLLSDLSLVTSKRETEQKEMKEIINEQEKKYKTQINKEKRKAECYKEKAIDAHTRNLHAKHLLRQKEQQQTLFQSSH